MQKKIEIILTPKDNGGHDMEFILNKDEFNGNAIEVAALLVSAAHNFGHKNLNTTQFVAFLEAEKDMCEKRKGMALLNELLNIFEKEKTNE
jgi:hypothetical protein